jgi:hypothetical protein
LQRSSRRSTKQSIALGSLPSWFHNPHLLEQRRTPISTACFQNVAEPLAIGLFEQSCAVVLRWTRRSEQSPDAPVDSGALRSIPDVLPSQPTTPSDCRAVQRGDGASIRLSPMEAATARWSRAYGSEMKVTRAVDLKVTCCNEYHPRRSVRVKFQPGPSTTKGDFTGICFRMRRYSLNWVRISARPRDDGKSRVECVLTRFRFQRIHHVH